MIYNKNVKGNINQGDIIFPVKVRKWLNWWDDDENYPIIILTPACDIEQKKAGHHRFCILEPFELFSYKLCEDIFGIMKYKVSETSNTKSDKFKNKLRNAVKNSWPRYHFIQNDGTLFTTDKIIDFEVVSSVPIDSFSKEFRVGRLESPYKEELIHRYSHHSTRIGTKDLPKDKVEDIISKCLNNCNN